MRFAPLVMVLAVPLASSSASRAQSADAGPAPAPGVTATVDCPRAAGPGRVRCEVEAKPPPGAVLKWADVQVVDAPPFATALRARVGPGDASIREEAAWRWTLALAARGRGTGEIHIRVRAVSCVHDACAPSEAVVGAALVVGE